MTRPRWLPIDRSQAIAAVLALALVASASGAATTALLSDREDVSVELAVERSPVSSFHVEPIRVCEPTTAENGVDPQLIEQFEVEGDGCANISIWVSQSWVEQSAGDVDNVVIGHDGGSGWTFFETTVAAERDGWYKLRATTDGFSPFGLFVANESVAGTEAGSAVINESDATNESEFNGTDATNESAVTDGGLNESTDGNGTATANESTENNATAQNGTESPPDTANGTQNGSAWKTGDNTSSPANTSQSSTSDDESTTEGGASPNGSATNDEATDQTPDATDGENESTTTSTPDGESESKPTDDGDDAENSSSESETDSETPTTAQPTEAESESTERTPTEDESTENESTPTDESASLSRVVMSR
ncbi:hypothetical protein [Halobellus salinisoli]|uniref:hypothetical protein n=1 Tax=Halobellus salinisoli TaxID=3108500 RepID=UPI00300BEB51